MSRVTDKQMSDLMRRRNLSPSDPKYISREQFQVFLRNPTITNVFGVTSSGVLDVRAKVEMMIEAGCHTMTNLGKGMSASEYMDLWPETVKIPELYEGVFDEILLIDRTIYDAKLAESARFSFAPNIHFRDLNCFLMRDQPVGLPVHSRYIVFVQLGEKRRDVSYFDSVKKRAAFEVCLDFHEGMNIAIQHREYLSQYSVDLFAAVVYVVCIRKFGNANPIFDTTRFPNQKDTYCGLATRGIQVIPIT